MVMSLKYHLVNCTNSRDILKITEVIYYIMLYGKNKILYIEIILKINI